MRTVKVITVIAGVVLTYGTLIGIGHAMDREDKAHRAQLSTVHTCWTEYNEDMAPTYLEGICGTADKTVSAVFVHWGLPKDGERIQEDSPYWNCKTMGNHICGPKQ